jgi:hypothetical protein
VDFIAELIASFFGALVATGSVLMIVDRRVKNANKEKK